MRTITIREAREGLSHLEQFFAADDQTPAEAAVALGLTVHRFF